MKKIKNYLHHIFENINLIHNKKGAMSIPFIIVMFIIVIFIAGYVDIMRASVVTEEFQGIMDLAGVAALREGIDDAKSFEKYGDDELYYSEGVIRSTFKELLAKQIKTNSQGPIIDYSVNSMTITELKNSKWGLGEVNEGRNQIVLDSIITIVVPVSSVFDNFDQTKSTFYNQLENTEFSVVSVNKKGDNKKVIVVRSVTRLVK